MLAENHVVQVLYKKIHSMIKSCYAKFLYKGLSHTYYVSTLRGSKISQTVLIYSTKIAYKREGGVKNL